MNLLQEMEPTRRRWADLPAPKRGEIVRDLGQILRENREQLGELVSLEMGKIRAEGIGEVQEAIDICDFAVGLSRTYAGSVIPSERPSHFMVEKWNPLNGYCGIISAFNFPVAVFYWNLALSLVVGNANIWKPSESTPLISLATMKMIGEVFSAHKMEGVVTMAMGNGAETGNAITRDKRVELISFTGSTHVGRIVSQEASKRFAKVLLELG